jgi:hypothetical protein
MMTHYRWRVADCHGDMPVPWPDDVTSLERAVEAAGQFLGTSSAGEAVALVWASARTGWYPVLFGAVGADRLEWHPWPSGSPGTELAVPAEVAPVVNAEPGEEEVSGGVMSGQRGDDIVTVSVDGDRPSVVARIAAQNRDLFEGEAAAQALPATVVDSLPLDMPAAIEARSGS